MASDRSQEIRRIAVTNADKSENFVTGCKRIVMIADADCFVDFDRPATTTGSFLMKANTPVSIPYLEYTQVHAICSSTANLYILAIR